MLPSPRSSVNSAHFVMVGQFPVSALSGPDRNCRFHVWRFGATASARNTGWHL